MDAGSHSKASSDGRAMTTLPTHWLSDLGQVTEGSDSLLLKDAEDGTDCAGLFLKR